MDYKKMTRAELELELQKRDLALEQLQSDGENFMDQSVAVVKQFCADEIGEGVAAERMGTHILRFNDFVEQMKDALFSPNKIHITEYETPHDGQKKGHLRVRAPSHFCAQWIAEGLEFEANGHREPVKVLGELVAEYTANDDGEPGELIRDYEDNEIGPGYFQQ